jgi:hypothetical protein
MLFVDFYGPADVYQATRAAVQEEIGRAFRTGPDSVVVRRFVVEGGRPDVELWVELSSDEEVYRYGRRIAREVSRVVRDACALDVWVMFRVVPLAHAFLNGEPRARGVEAAFE